MLGSLYYIRNVIVRLVRVTWLKVVVALVGGLVEMRRLIRRPLILIN